MSATSLSRAAPVLSGLLLATVFVPLALLLSRAGSPGSWPAAWATTEALHALRGTLVTSVGASLFALGLGLPLALCAFRLQLPGQALLRAVSSLPSAIPPYIWTMGWIALANPRSGWLTLLVGRDRLDVYGAGGIAFVLGTSALPLVVLATGAALERIDPGLEEAARLCGASPWRAFFTVTLPLIAPSMLSGAALVFVFSSASFGVPYLLGVAASPPTPTLTTRIYTQVLMGESGLASAAVSSLELLALAVLVLIGNAWLSRAGRVRIPRGKGQSGRVQPLGRWRWPVAMAVWSVTALVTLLPLAAVFFTALQANWGQLGPPTLTHWGVLLQPRTLSAASVSLALGALAALLVAGFGLAIALTRRRWLETLADAPSAIPGTVLALGLLIAFSRDVRFIAFERVAVVLALGNTFWLVLLAYVVKHLSLGVRSSSDALAQADPSLGEAARLAGAGPVRAFLDGLLPQIRGALGGAMLLTFLTCASELTMSVLLIPTGQDVLGTLLFELQSYADPSSAAVIASALLLIVFFGLLAQRLVTPRREPR